jgi:glycosyltransferase involved in cell wall biosynthesis
VTIPGIERCIVNLVRGHSALGWRIVVACPTSGPLRVTARNAGAEYRAWNARREPTKGLATEARELRRIIRQFRPDIVHLHSSKAGLVGRVVVHRSIPTVFHPNAWAFHAAGGVTGRLALAWERQGARLSYVVICASRGEADEAIAAGIDCPKVIIPNGVDPDEFPFATTETQRLARDTLGLSQGDPLVVCIGRVCPQKGQDVLLDAWPHVLARTPHAALVCVGDGPLRDRLEALRVPRVTFTGNQDNVYPWIAAADVITVPSRWDGMSFALLEAMASGRSVVGTRVAGASEVLCQGAGGLVPSESPKELAHAISIRLENTDVARVEGLCGRRIVEDRFSANRASADVADLYRHMLGNYMQTPKRPNGVLHETSQPVPATARSRVLSRNDAVDSRANRSDFMRG